MTASHTAMAFKKYISYFVSFKYKSNSWWRWKGQRMPKSKEKKKTITCNLPVQSGESPLGALVTPWFFLASCSRPSPAVPPHSLGTAEHFGSPCSCAPVLARHWGRRWKMTWMSVGHSCGGTVHFLQETGKMASRKTQDMGKLINHKVSRNPTRQLKCSIWLLGKIKLKQVARREF